MTTDPFTSAGPKPEDSREAKAKRDGYGRYLIPKLPGDLAEQFKTKGYADPLSGDSPWTRATTFAKSISDTFTLSQWSQRMVAKGLASRDDLILAAAACPVTDKGTLDGIVEQANDAAATRASANLGTAMHQLTEDWDAGRLTDLSTVPAVARMDLSAYAGLVEEHGLKFSHVEQTVVNTRWGIAGTFDRAGNGRIVDLKTSRDLQYGWTEIAIQIAVYATADAIWDWERKVFLPMPEVSRTHGLVIHLPVGKGSASLYAVDLTEALAAADLCAAVRKWRKTKNLAKLVSVGESTSRAAVREFIDTNQPDRPVPTEPIEALSGMEQADLVNGELPTTTGRKRRACSKCRVPGHTAKNCPGPAEPAAEAVTTNVSEYCQQGPECTKAGWTRGPEGGPFVCGSCGKPSRTVRMMETAAEESARDTAGPADVRRTAPRSEVLGTMSFDGPQVDNSITTSELMTGVVDRAISAQDEVIEDPFAESPPAAVRPPTWLERVQTAGSKAELRQIRDEATAAGVWSADLQTAGIARVRQITEPAS